jgi:hypothetical protein
MIRGHNVPVMSQLDWAHKYQLLLDTHGRPPIIGDSRGV